MRVFVWQMCVTDSRSASDACFHTVSCTAPCTVPEPLCPLRAPLFHCLSKLCVTWYRTGQCNLWEASGGGKGEKRSRGQRKQSLRRLLGVQKQGGACGVAASHAPHLPVCPVGHGPPAAAHTQRHVLHLHLQAGKADRRVSLSRTGCTGRLACIAWRGVASQCHSQRLCIVHRMLLCAPLLLLSMHHQTTVFLSLQQLHCQLHYGPTPHLRVNPLELQVARGESDTEHVSSQR